MDDVDYCGRACPRLPGKRLLLYRRPQPRWDDGYVVRNKFRLWHVDRCPFNRKRMDDVDCEWASTWHPGKKPVLYRRPQPRWHDGHVVRNKFRLWHVDRCPFNRHL